MMLLWNTIIIALPFPYCYYPLGMLHLQIQPFYRCALGVNITQCLPISIMPVKSRMVRTSYSVAQKVNGDCCKISGSVIISLYHSNYESFCKTSTNSKRQLYYNFLICSDTSCDGHQKGLYESISLSSIFYMIVVPHKHIPM